MTQKDKRAAAQSFKDRLKALHAKRAERNGTALTLAEARADLAEAHATYVELLQAAPNPPSPRAAQVRQMVAHVGTRLDELKCGLPDDPDKRDELIIEFDSLCVGLLRETFTRAGIPFDRPAPS